MVRLPATSLKLLTHRTGDLENQRIGKELLRDLTHRTGDLEM